MKYLNKFICVVLTSILFLALSMPNARCNTLSPTILSPDNSARLKVDLTNFIEPSIGKDISFACDSKSNQNNDKCYFIPLAWLELDLTYDEIQDFFNFVFPNPESVENNNDVIMDYVEENVLKLIGDIGLCYNESIIPEGYADQVYSGLSEDSALISEETGLDISVHQINKFSPNKTYLCMFAGAVGIDVELTPEGPVFEEIDEPDNFDLSNISISLYNLSINGKSNNSRGICIKMDMGGDRGPIYEAFGYAIYSTKIPLNNITATVNWNNSNKNIPNSLILKLMNGSTVVKEQTITKENAIKDDVWEYNFGEYPTLDENGNNISYTLDYQEVNEGDLKYYTTNVNGFTIDNTFKGPEINSNVYMKSTFNRDSNNVKYKIDYSASVKNYSGDADVVIKTTLSYPIDTSKSDLDGGIYDNATHEIIWKEELKNIDKEYEYRSTKNVTLYPTAVLPYSIDATTLGQVQLKDADEYYNYSNADNHIDNVGNPKTGDINIIKYMSIALVGIGTVLMLIQIKRKYSTKKNKVLF